MIVNLKLYMFGLFMLLSLLTTALTALLKTNIYFNLYPYVLALLAGILGSLTLPQGVYSLRKDMRDIVIVGLCILASTLYQVLVLDEVLFFVLYSMRFYFGGVFLIIFYLQFFRSCDIAPEVIKKWILGFVEIAIVFNFFMAAAEIFFGASFWIPASRFREGIDELSRSFGFTGNSAVLGGFSVFLTLYYFSQNQGSLRMRNWFILLLGLITLGLSQSGTGYYCFALAILAIFYNGIRHKLLLIPIIFAFIAFSFVILLGQEQLDEGGRLTVRALIGLIQLHGLNVCLFAQQAIDGSLFNLVLGSFNFMKYTTFTEKLWFIEGNSSIYDFAYIAMLLEVGLVGFAAYLWFYIRAASRAFGKEAFLSKFSIYILLFGSLHYGVSFWICSQVMSGLLLTAHMDMNAKGRARARPGIKARKEYMA